jgi:hypothetical protein
LTSEISHALDRLIVLTCATCGVLLVILVSQIGLSVRLREMNAKLSAITTQLEALP